jgi:membrane protein DedA with SNARE-associated domain
VETILPYVTDYGYTAIFVLLMMGVIGLPVPDESVLALAGLLVDKGQLSLLPTAAVAFLGSICGITISYGVGWATGVHLLQRYGNAVHITPDKLLKVHRWFTRHGPWVLPVGYFVPGVRHVTALVAGSTKLAYPDFALFAYAGGLVWSFTFVMIGYVLGEEWRMVIEESILYRTQLVIAVAAASVFAYLVWVVFSRKVRR